MSAEPGPTPEGLLIGEAAAASGRSNRKLADEAGVSEGHWRQIVKGFQVVAGQAVPRRAKADLLARMAAVLGLTPQQLAEAGRADAASILERMSEEIPDSYDGSTEPSVFLVMAEGGMLGAFTDRDRALCKARALGGVVAALPIIADYRPPDDQ